MEEKLTQQAEELQENPERNSIGKSINESINEPISEPINEHRDSEKSSTWSVKLYEADRIRLMNLLDVIPVENRREAFMDIITKAEVATAKEQAATGFVAELEKYTKAIMQSAVRQVSMFEAAEAAYKGDAQQRLDAESKAKEEAYKEIKMLREQIKDLNGIIKIQKDKLTDCADALFKKQEQIDNLKVDFETAQRNVEAVAEIQKEYSMRLKKAETAKVEAEAEVVKVQRETEEKLKVLTGDFEAFKKSVAKETSRLSSAFSAAEALAAARETQITQLAATNAQLMGMLAAAQEKLGGAAAMTESNVKDSDKVVEKGKQK